MHNPNLNNNLAYQPQRLQLPARRATPGIGQAALNLQPMNRNDMYMEPLQPLQPLQFSMAPQIKSVVYKTFILVFGAQKETSNIKEILAYNLENQEWRTITPEGNLGIDLRSEYNAYLLNNDSVVLYGSAIQNNGEAPNPLGMMNQQQAQACCQILTLTESSSINIINVSKPLQAQYGRSKVFDSITLPVLTGAAANIHKQKLYLCGGMAALGGFSSDLFIIDCSTEEFRVKKEPLRSSPFELAPAMTPRFGHFGVVYKEKIYYYGGLGSNLTDLFDMWSLNLNSLVWEEIQFSTLRPNIKTIFGRIAGDTIFFFGGFSKSPFETFPTGDLEMITYKIESHAWATLDTKINLKPGAICEVYQNTVIFGEPLNLSSVSIGESSSQNGNSNTNFRASDRKLFIEKPFADITFNVDGEQILAHKALLATRSQHFSNMFQSGMKESTSTVIDIPDTKATIFNGFLEFLYCGNIQNLQEDVATELLKFADKYSVSGLREYCEQFLINKLKIGNVISLTNLAEFCSAEKLEKAGILFIAENFEEIFKEYDIKQLSSSILFEVFRFVKGKGAK